MNLTKLKTMAEFDENWAYNLAKTHDFGPLSEVGSRVACARYQYTKDKALNELLVRIVERQNIGLELFQSCTLPPGDVSGNQMHKDACSVRGDVAKLIEEFKP